MLLSTLRCRYLSDRTPRPIIAMIFVALGDLLIDRFNLVKHQNLWASNGAGSKYHFLVGRDVLGGIHG